MCDQRPDHVLFRKSFRDAPLQRCYFPLGPAQRLESPLQLRSLSVQKPLVRRNDFQKLTLVARELLLELRAQLFREVFGQL